MLNKVKNMLGIEGVKMELLIPDVIISDTKRIGGIIKFTTLSDQQIMGFSVKMVEKYTRGKGESALINEYILGSISKQENFKITKDEIIEFDFELPFVTGQSEMDKFAEDNFFYRALVKTAKYFKNVKSQYKVVAEAHVKGVKLNPSVEKLVEIR